LMASAVAHSQNALVVLRNWASHKPSLAIIYFAKNSSPARTSVTRWA
jgi:hypothetical protein